MPIDDGCSPPITATQATLGEPWGKPKIMCTEKWQEMVQGRSQITERFYVTLKGPSVQFSLVAQSCPTLCDPMNCSTPGLPVNHQLPEFTQTHVH